MQHKDFLDQAEQIVMQVLRDVRPELMENYGKIDYETKYDRTVVTHLDRYVEEKLTEALLKLDAAIGIEGEEFGIQGSRKTYWTLDPIDGTEQFIRGIPTCKNLLSLVEDEQPVWALMYVFPTDELWLARKGEGLTRNGETVLREHRPLERCWLDLNVDLKNPENIQTLLRLQPHVANYTILRNTLYQIGGEADGLLALEAGGGPWDYAPRALLFTESGATIANIGSDTYDFRNNNFLMAHRDNFDQLMNLIAGVK